MLATSGPLAQAMNESRELDAEVEKQ